MPESCQLSKWNEIEFNVNLKGNHPNAWGFGDGPVQLEKEWRGLIDITVLHLFLPINACVIWTSPLCKPSSTINKGLINNLWDPLFSSGILSSREWEEGAMPCVHQSSVTSQPLQCLRGWKHAIYRVRKYCGRSMVTLCRSARLGTLPLRFSAEVVFASATVMTVRENCKLWLGKAVFRIAWLLHLLF